MNLLHDLTAKVASALHARVVTREDLTNSAFIEGDGYRLAVSMSDRLPGRLTIGARVAAQDEDLLNRHGYKTYGQEISVAWTKTPNRIAKDITRRLLPDARALYAEQRARTESYRAAIEGAQANAACLSHVDWSTRDRPHQTSRLGVVRVPGRVTGDVEVHRDTVTLTLRSLSVAQAQAILQIVSQADDAL